MDTLKHLLLLLLLSPAFAQVQPQITGAGAPANPCFNAGQQYLDTTNHVLYNCPGNGSNWANIGLGNLTNSGGIAVSGAVTAGHIATFVNSSTIQDGGAAGGAGTVTNTGGNLTSNAVVLGAGTSDTKVSTGITTNGGSELDLGVVGTNGVLGLKGLTSGTAIFTAPAVAGTVLNPVIASNALELPASSTASTNSLTFVGGTTSGIAWDSGALRLNFVWGGGYDMSINGPIITAASTGVWGFTSTAANNAADTGMSRGGAAGLIAVGTGAAASTAGFIKTAQTVSLSADWTCGTGGIVSSCVAATIIGSTATPLTFTLPLVAANWSFECDLVVGQATAATANQWNVLTATNGVTSTTASYQMATAATAFAAGAVTDQASTTTTFQITPSWTLGGTATKMPVHIAGTLTGVSASGTVFSLQLVAPTVADLVTIYEGSKCSLNP